MNDFWNNISRYPRFFISTLVGLILVILAPVKNVFKVRKLRIIVIISISIIVVAMYLIIQNMLGF